MSDKPQAPDTPLFLYGFCHEGVEIGALASTVAYDITSLLNRFCLAYHLTSESNGLRIEWDLDDLKPQLERLKTEFGPIPPEIGDTWFQLYFMTYLIKYHGFILVEVEGTFNRDEKPEVQSHACNDTGGRVLN
jgi:hypothetical protein